MSKVDDALQTQINNIGIRYGKPVDAWVALAHARGLTKVKAIIDFLKAEHSFSHGDANRVALIAANSGTGSNQDGEALIDAQYAGKKAAMRPIYDKLAGIARAFGGDVEFAPKKAWVSLRRAKQFGCIQPMASRVDVGLNLKGVSPAGRLEASASNGMFTHVIKVASLEAVDAELTAWLRRAYEEAR